MGNAKSSLPPLQTVPKCETAKFMGTWFVIGNLPTFPERMASNAVERYTLRQGAEAKSHDLDIDFQFNHGDPIKGKLKSLPQKGWIESEDKSTASEWKVSPAWPIKMPYPIIELDEEQYGYCVVGYPSRAYVWIMGRQPSMDDKVYDMLCDRLQTKHGYDLKDLRKVPQRWTLAEREKRGLTANEIPDDVLQKE